MLQHRLSQRPTGVPPRISADGHKKSGILQLQMRAAPPTLYLYLPESLC